jgi:hypothetical protein
MPKKIGMAQLDREIADALSRGKRYHANALQGPRSSLRAKVTSRPKFKPGGEHESRRHSTIKGFEISADQLAALRTFAKANGRSWKSKLNHAWSTGRYDDYSGTDDYGSLQQIRNRFGPAWLSRFSFDRAKTHSVNG